MLPRRHRLTLPWDFTDVVRGRGGSGVRRRSAGTALLAVHRRDVDRPDAASPRVGVVVSKTVGNSVVRHRVSRRLRAIVATRIQHWPAGTDLVVRATARAARASSAELGAALDQALTKVGRR